MSEGDPCPKCGTPLEIRAAQFYWRGRYFTGLVCKPCNALFDNPRDSFFAHVKTTSPRTDG
jgi:hypothetical protein